MNGIAAEQQQQHSVRQLASCCQKPRLKLAVSNTASGDNEVEQSLPGIRGQE